MKLRTVALDDLAPPAHLGHEAQAFWSRHAPALARNQLLTAQTADQFAILCDLWERYEAQRGQPTSPTFLNLEKALRALLTLFRLSPCQLAKVKESRDEDAEVIPIDYGDDD